MPTRRSKAVPGEVSPRDDVLAVRQFNRFYTAQIGALDKGHLDSAFGLTEARVLYELAHRESITATDLASDLKLDAGYVSRLLQRFRAQKLVAVKPSPDDARQRLLSLTARGHSTFALLNTRANESIEQMLTALPDESRGSVVQAMQTLQRLLTPHEKSESPFLLRTHQPGDIGWVISRHGEIYTREFGWDATFEALVAKVGATFLEKFDGKSERCWIAERDGVRVGSVFLVRKDATTAQLRLLLVDPGARGLGIGERLVSECERFAREAGYASIKLWTQRNLLGARRIYERAGYKIVSTESHVSFGVKLQAEDWEKTARLIAALDM